MKSTKALTSSESSSSSSSSSFDRDWAWLPQNLLFMVLNKLFLLSDMIGFASVCSHWRSVAKCRFEELNLRANMHFTRKLPMLLVPSTENNDCIRNLYSITDTKIYDLRLPVPHTKRYCGSSRGWLIILDNKSFEVTLVNPFYFGHMQGSIQLPPFIAAQDASEEAGENFHLEYFVSKAILSTDPIASPNDYALMLIYGEMRMLGLWKSGDTHWTYINWPILIFSDLIYSNGQFLAVNNFGQIYSCDIVSKPPTFSAVYGPHLDIPGGNCRRYIVELPDRTIVQVIRVLRTCVCNKDVPLFYTAGFVLFTLQDHNGTKNWLPVDTLRDGALFLGDNYSMYVVASQFPGCRPNSVYFTDDVQDADMKLLISHQFTCRREIGIYHLDNYMIERIECPLPKESRLPPPIWITPTI
ncbi:hypothetical protein RND81_14G114500 [Saponaria officinalis]|uniref:KIB1-4 beta-propeller domain-containing protein n=1 Tax=Saponaria officinalis TaxID=3572 RepID=A0AAW1GST7_SAPOF